MERGTRKGICGRESSYRASVGTYASKHLVSVSPTAAELACEHEPSAEFVRPEDKSIVGIVLF